MKHKKCKECILKISHKLCPQYEYDKEYYMQIFINPMNDIFNKILNENISNPQLLYNLLDEYFDNFLDNYDDLKIKEIKI